MSPLAITFVCIAGILLVMFIAYFCMKSKDSRNAQNEERRHEERREERREECREEYRRELSEDTRRESDSIH